MSAGYTCRTSVAKLLELSLLVAFSALLFPTRTQAQLPVLDFETGNMQGWTLTGNAFGCQPMRAGSQNLRGGAPQGHQGNYWVSTYGCMGPGTGDRLEGTATYGPFQIQAGTLSFLIGGSRSSETRVELLVSDPIEQQQVSVLHASGQGTETMQRVTWDLKPYAGKRGWIRIVDASNAPAGHNQVGGHLNVDDFRFAAAAQTAGTPKPPSDLLSKILGSLSQSESAQPRTVPVPQLVSHSLDEVPDILKRASLRLGTVTRRESPAKPGTVIEQDPRARTRVRQGFSVNVVVANEQLIVVPTLIGHSVEEAHRMIIATERLKFTVGGGRESREKPGTVLEQNPQPETRVRPGTTVSVVLATEVTPVVPNVVGLDVRDAEKTITGTRGLEFAVRGGRESPEKPGTVLEQTPLAGTRVQPGTTVGVTLATEVIPVVPNVVGLNVGDAEKMIMATQRLKFAVRGQQESSQAPDTVLEQTPLPGTRVQNGTTVGVILATEKMIVVPDLLGRNVRDAEKMVAAMRGLEFAVRGQRESSRPPDTVIGQNPAAGTKVRAGAILGVTIAKGRILMVTVPDLVGHSKDEAERIVANTPGLQLKLARARASDLAPGTILTQNPPAGTTVPEGSTVEVDVAESQPVVSVRLQADPPKAKAGSVVVFTVKVTPNVPGLRYVFDFGDQTAQSTSAEPFIRHTYSSVGIHPAVVVVKRGDVPYSTSNVVPVSIERGLNLALLVWIITGIGVLAGGSYYKTKPMRQHRQLKRAGISFKPVKSLGHQQLEPPPAGSVTNDIRLNAVTSAGEQMTEVGCPLVSREEVLHE